jgi:rhamnogalacturonan endolyase
LSTAPVIAVPAFPGAEGFGASATGGRGGAVYHVTNLNDSGAGSFRDAVSASGRTVVFDVGGIIRLASDVSVSSNVTIAGETAPGEGICLYGRSISLSSHSNIIMRYLRIRQGISGDSGNKALGMDSSSNIIIDHCTIQWGRWDDLGITNGSHDITLQYCIIAEGINPQSFGALIDSVTNITLSHNLWISNESRNPKAKGTIQFINNVVYDWAGTGLCGGHSAADHYLDVIGNAFIAGPSSNDRFAGQFTATDHVYQSGNLVDLDRDGALNGLLAADADFHRASESGYTYPTFEAAPAMSPGIPVTVDSAAVAYHKVVAEAGCSLHRDAVDQRLISELTSLGLQGHTIPHADPRGEALVGGLGAVTGGLAAKDTDNDGMPDWWEQAAATDPLTPDHNADSNGDGYTNLENYVNALAHTGTLDASIDTVVDDTGASASDGITSDNGIVLRGTAVAGASVTVSRVDLGEIGTVAADATGHWEFDYSGTTLVDRPYAFQAVVALAGGGTSTPTPAFVVTVDTTPAAAPAITSIAASPAMTITGTSEPGSTVSVMIDGGGVVGTAVADGIGNWNAPYTGPALAPGVYTFTARAVDVAGNAGAESPPYSVDTSLAAPVFTAIVTDSGASSADNYTNDGTLVFNGTSFAGATVTLTRAGVGVIGTTTAGGAGTWSFDYTGTTLPAGIHTFTATASNGGPASPASAPLSVTVDTTRPKVSSIARQDPGTSATTASTLVFRVAFAEPVTGVTLNAFSLTLGSGVTATLSALSPVDAATYDVTVTGATGDSTVRLDAKSSGTGIVDQAGNAMNTGFTSGQTYTLRLPGSGVWSSTQSGDAWSDPANWEDGIVATGAGATADFTHLSDDFVVQLDTPRTVGRLVFGDPGMSDAALWTLSDNGSGGNVLTLDGPTPNLHVNAVATSGGDTVDVPSAADSPTTLDVVLAGSKGFTKTGIGTLVIAKPATITGPLTISKGIVQVGPGGSLEPSSVAISTSQQLRIAGGTFTTTGDVTWNSGTGTGLIVSSGTGTFQRILPSNTRNSFVRVTGGTFSATEINFPRSGDSESQALAAGIQISGGDSTIGSVGLGTNNSWGAMTISGGNITVTGAVQVGFQVTSGRGGDVVVSGGEFNVTNASTGLILARNPITDSPSRANNSNQIAKFTITGGVSNVARLALGYDATSSGGSGTVSLTNGELNIGSGGIVKNGTSGMNTSITLHSGVLGAMAAWTTSHAIVVDGTPSTLAIRAGSASDERFDVALAGALTGTGGFAKTGGGTLVLSANETYGGATEINAGSLRVLGALASGGDVVSINSGGTLSGDGTIDRTVVLNDGGTLAPDGATSAATLTATSLTWNGGGSFACDLGASGNSDALAISGALTKGAAGTYAVAFTAGSGFAAGNTYTVATFAATDFVAHDFTATGLPAGTGALFEVKDTSLEVRIQARPHVTSPTDVTGTYGAPLTYVATATETPVTFSATGLPAGLTLDPTSGIVSGTPAAAGPFTVAITATNTAGSDTIPVTFDIAKAVAPVSIGTAGKSLVHRSYDGTPKTPDITTEPAGLTATFTYNGSPTPPTLPGTYVVVATIDDPNYQGSAQGTLVITITALVRHAPALNGDIDGSMQVLSPENVTLNGSTVISGDVLVPGTPSVMINGAAILGGTRDEMGDAAPANYRVTLNGHAMARYVVRRVNPIAMPTVAAPHAPTGSRTIVLTAHSAPVDDFTTVRNLTVIGDVGAVAIPPGAYGIFTVSGNSTLVLGNAGETEPAVYELQGLVLNGSAGISVVGPVTLRLGNGVVINGGVGSAADPSLLSVEMNSGGVILNGNAVLHGTVVAPNGQVSINGNAELHGRVTADRLTINGNAVLEDAP